MLGPALVVIGNFDGVHRGHAGVLSDGGRLASERGLALVVLTFVPHPAIALGRQAPPLLTALPRKRVLVERAAPGARLEAMRFDTALAAQTPAEFAERVLKDRLGARIVQVGQNFRFGHDRAGDFAELTRLGATLGFETRSLPLVGDEAGPWSSTRVRQAVAAGDVAEAARVLGRPHALDGVVTAGDKLGRTLGFRTANLDAVAEALPRHGVYAVLVDRLEGGVATALARGVANIGVRPTLGAPALRIEAHLFDRDDDLYGARLRVHLVARIRDEQRFASLDELKARIAADATEARALTASAVPAPDARGAWA